jgi:hypothetical protein
MLQLNLISKNLKKEIKIRQIYQIFKKICYIIIIYMVFVGIILLTARIIMQNNFNNIVVQTSYITKNAGKFTTETKEINEKLNYVSKIQSEFVPWSLLLKKIQEQSKNIKLLSIKINKDKKTIELKGMAESRDSLIEFRDWLEESSYFHSIEFPLRNILARENIDFDINARINLDNFLKDIK